MHDDRYDDDRYYDRLLRKVIVSGLAGIAVGLLIELAILVLFFSPAH